MVADADAAGFDRVIGKEEGEVWDGRGRVGEMPKERVHCVVGRVAGGRGPGREGGGSSSGGIEEHVGRKEVGEGRNGAVFEKGGDGLRVQETGL